MNGIIIIVFGIFFRNIVLIQNDVLMAFFVIKVRKPPYTFYTNKFPTSFINATSSGIQFIIIWYPKFSITAMYTCA